MPYMDWHVVFQAFGFKIVKCDECGTYHLQSKRRTIRIWGKSCSRHFYHNEKLS